MKKGRKRTVFILTLALILCGCVVIPAFALLMHDTNVDFNVEFGDIPQESMDFSAAMNQTFSFTQAGDKHDIALPTTNKSNRPVAYSYHLTAGAGGALAAAVMVYYDGVLVGTLAEAVAKPLAFEGVNNILAAAAGAEQDSVTHRLTFELHKAAEGSFMADKTCHISITLKARTIDYRTNIMVGTAEELEKALSDISYSEGDYKIIRLTDVITLDKDLTVNAAGSIDTHNGGINFNGFSITLVNGAKPYIFTLNSSRMSSYQPAADGGIVLDGANSCLDLDASVGAYSGLVTLTSYDKAAAALMVTGKIMSRAKQGIRSATPTEIFGGNDLYITNANALTFAGGEHYTLAGKVITPVATTITLLDKITVGGKVVEFKIIGSEDTAMQYLAIIDSGLSHLARLTVDNNPLDVDFDLFLPAAVPSINANIEWWSSNSSIMTVGGKCGDTVEGLVTMIATIRINNDIITREYTFSVLKQSNQMRFDYLVARIGEKRLSAIYDVATNPAGSNFTLPIVRAGATIDYRAMYNMRSLGLESITYELSPTYNYLTMNGTPSTVYLSASTFDEYAEIKIKGVFSNDKNTEYVAAVGIVIDRIDSADLHKRIIEYIQGLAGEINILDNILATRRDGIATEKGDFVLPAEYKGFQLAYSNVDDTATGVSTNGILKSITAGVDPETELGYYTFVVDPTKFYNKNTAITFGLSIKMKNWSEGDLTTNAPIQIATPGALHHGTDVVDESLFYTTRLQLIQQIVDAGGSLQEGVPKIESDVVTTDIMALSRNYILLSDTKYLRSLIIVTGDKTYNNASQLMALDIEEGLFYYNVNTMDVGYSGLGAFKELRRLKIVNEGSLLTDTLSNGNIAISKETKADALLNFAVNNYTRLEKLSMIKVHVTDGTRLKQLDDLIFLDLSGNANMSEIGWTMERVSHRFDYLNITGTAFKYADNQGELMSLYYRHITATAKQPDIWYTDISGVKVRYTTNTDKLGQEINNKLYGIAFEKRAINSAAYQLVPSVTAEGSVYNIVWTIYNAEGRTDAYITEGKKIINNHYYSSKPADRPFNYEVFTLTATVTYKVDVDGVMVDRVITRSIAMSVVYAGAPK